jgi:PREDICTED: angio-associated migratory cell protein-like
MINEDDIDHNCNEIILDEEDWESVHELSNDDKPQDMSSDENDDHDEDKNYNASDNSDIGGYLIFAFMKCQFKNLDLFYFYFLEVDECSVDWDKYKDEAILTFQKHTDAVYCCSLSKSGKLAISGGGDDKGFLWNTHDGRVHLEIVHKDSLVGISFNHDESLLASVDMKGFLQVYNAQSFQNIYQYNLEDDVTWMKWHPFQDIILVGSASGITWMISLDDVINPLDGFGSSTTCGEIFKDGRRVVAGYDTGYIRIFDIQTFSPIHSIKKPGAHEDSVVSLDITKDDSLIATGSIDSTAKLINSNSGKVVCTILCGKMPENDNSNNTVESVCFCNDLPLLATGSINGLLEIWDINTQKKRNQVELPSGIVKMAWPSGPSFLLFVAGLDGVLHILDGRDGSLKSTKSGHKHHILDFSLSQSNELILTSSEDKTCRLFLNN